jgi:hypothetical protein
MNINATMNIQNLPNASDKTYGVVDKKKITEDHTKSL